MKLRVFLIFAIIILALFPLWSCGGGGYAHVTIMLGLPHHAVLQAAPTVFERIYALFPLFPTNAHAAVPANITKLRLQVTQGGMVTFEESFSPTSSSISVDVPSGSGLVLTVTAYIDPLDPGAVLEYAGSANADLAPGEDVTISIQMLASETKLVIPNYGMGTIIQIDDINDTTPSTYTPPALYNPYDVAFDARGRIYVALGSSGLIRIDTISGANFFSGYDTTSGGMGGSLRAVAVDRAAGLVYYANAGNMIRRTTLTPGTYATYTPSLLTQVTGLAVADDGILYISGVYNGDDAVVRFDPEAGAVIGAPYVGGMITRRSLHVKISEPYVYVINASYVSTPVGEILRFTKSLQYAGKAGSVTSTFSSIVSAPMEFFHPVHFVAVLNRKFVLMDTDTVHGYPVFDRVVSFGDLSGSDWSAYAELDGSGSSMFSFLSYS
ncbi:MAG: hypothetical protein EPN93_04640 [Spirochaetes bacterium]|nr:MAG: hypothetical protein EPN93_04640 [Spirochaetota bacterium]